MNEPYYGALERDDHGDLPREQDHELPDTPAQRWAAMWGPDREPCPVYVPLVDRETGELIA